jgi:hypothetical protein
MIITENTSERLVIVEPVSASGGAIAWITPVNRTLKLLWFRSPKVKELAGCWQPQQEKQARSRHQALPGHPMNYAKLRRMPLNLGFLAWWQRQFESERETCVDYTEKTIFQTERGLYAQNQTRIPFSMIDSVVMQKQVDWKAASPTNVYRLYLKMRGQSLLFFEHMDKGRVEELLRGLVSRLQLNAASPA